MDKKHFHISDMKYAEVETDYMWLAANEIKMRINKKE